MRICFSYKIHLILQIRVEQTELYIQLVFLEYLHVENVIGIFVVSSYEIYIKRSMQMGIFFLP